VKYADDFVLLVKEELVLQGIINTITEIGRYYGIEMNMEKLRQKETKINIRTESVINKNNCRIWIF